MIDMDNQGQIEVFGPEIKKRGFEKKGIDDGQTTMEAVIFYFHYP